MARPDPLPASFFLLDKEGSHPEERVQLQVGDEAALVLFTSEAKAERYRDRRLDSSWEISSMKRADVLEWLADAYQGIGEVAIDPDPDAPPKLVPIFQTLLDLQ